MKQRPVLIGLTGNIATGKSEVARLLAELGANVIDADRIAHQVMRPGSPVLQAVVDAFGSDILGADGSLARGRLGAIVFRDGAALSRLEAIVHPAVITEVDRRIDQALERVVVVEAIKLIESGMHRGYDEIWVVSAPRPMQMSRLVAMRGLSLEEAALRIDAQPPQAEKIALADRHFVNDGDLDTLRQQVQVAWDEMLRRFSRQEFGLPLREDVPCH